jgi:hypothetical protein
MSPLIRALTLVLLAIPAAFLMGPLYGRPDLLSLALVVGTTYLWVWTRFRPTRFVVTDDAIHVVWPLKRRLIERRTIKAVRLVGARDLREMTGMGLRIGAGGLWGGFGWLWTQRCGIVQMYVSRADEFVWIDRGNERPWLITPERPTQFVRSVNPLSG